MLLATAILTAMALTSCAGGSSGPDDILLEDRLTAQAAESLDALTHAVEDGIAPLVYDDGGEEIFSCLHGGAMAHHAATGRSEGSPMTDTIAWVGDGAMRDCGGLRGRFTHQGVGDDSPTGSEGVLTFQNDMVLFEDCFLDLSRLVYDISRVSPSGDFTSIARGHYSMSCAIGGISCNLPQDDTTLPDGCSINFSL